MTESEAIDLLLGSVERERVERLARDLSGISVNLANGTYFDVLAARHLPFTDSMKWLFGMLDSGKYPDVRLIIHRFG